MKIKTSLLNNQASSFWLGQEFDLNFRENTASTVDYTKLAATQRAIGNFVNIVTGKQIPVIFKNSDSSYTDGKRVVIGTKLDGKNFDPAVGLALHEGSHIAFTDFSLFDTQYLQNSKFAKFIRMRGLDPDMTMAESDFRIIKDLLNWIEDRRIDYKVYTNAPGYRLYYESMYNKYFNDPIIDKALLAGEKRDETLDSYMFHIINFTNPNRQLDALKSLRAIWNCIDLKNIQRLQSTIDALELACDVYSILQHVIKNNNATNNVNQNGSSNQTDPATSGDVNDSNTNSNAGGDIDPMDPEDDANFDDDFDDDFDDEDSSEGSSSSKHPGLSDKDLTKLSKAIDAQRNFINGDVQKQGRLTKKDTQIVDAIKESGTETRMVNTGPAGNDCPVTTIVIKKLTSSIIQSLPVLFLPNSGEILKGEYKYSSMPRNIELMDKAVQRGVLLGKKLGAKLQLRNSDKSLKSTRLSAGKIDRRLISQLGYNNVNVFHRVITNRYKNYFIHISIDASGSMGGDKFYQAITSAVAVAQAASMTTGIRVQISLRGTENIGSNTEKCVTICAYDSAHDKMNKIKTYFKYLKTFGCTPEGIAFKSIEQDIISDAKGDELIFINYSDGDPTSVSGASHQYNGVEFTKHVINSFRSNGINVISYFIHDGTVWENTRRKFHTMYGVDAQFICPDDMRDIAKTMNSKFLEICK